MGGLQGALKDKALNDLGNPSELWELKDPDQYDAMEVGPALKYWITGQLFIVDYEKIESCKP